MSEKKELERGPRPFTARELEHAAKMVAAGHKIEAVWDGLQCSFKITGGKPLIIAATSGGDCEFKITS